MQTTRPAYIIDAVRTPIGKFRGGLSAVRTDDLAALTLRALIARHPALRDSTDQVILGSTNQAGEDNRNVARMAALLADLPFETPAVTMNRLCGSGLESVTDAAMRIWTGDADICIAGGVESMTRAPYVMGKAAEPFSRQTPKIFDTSIGWRFENPKMAERFPLMSMGETAENVAAKWKITREEQDAFAHASHQKASRAWDDEAFAEEVIKVEVPQRKGDPLEVTRDESVRPDTSIEKLAKLAPVFKKGGSVTAGNSSPINDGASAVAIASEDAMKRLGVEPMARVVAFATAGVDPNLMGEGPIPAGKKALKRAGWRVTDLDLVELNEAFAAQSIACLRGLELDPARVNVRGGAIAIGHPIGASGARVLTTLVHAMKQKGATKGMATLCIGVGQGIAMLVER